MKIVEIIITDHKLKTKALKLLREFTDDSIYELCNRLEANEPVYTIKLLSEQFYSDVSNVCLLLRKLDELKIKHLLLINGLESTHENIADIEKSVEKISLSDFR
jgi:hypothetical protein